MTKNRKNNIKNGICTDCTKQATTINGKINTRCIDCINNNKKRSKEFRERCKKNGLCIACGKQKELKETKGRCKTCRLKQKEMRQNKRLKFFKLYGEKCVCCGEDFEPFLTLDHINNDGNKTRKTKGGNKNCFKEYTDAINNFNPLRYQTLCYNCNCAKTHRPINGNCPCKSLQQKDLHKLERET